MALPLAGIKEAVYTAIDLDVNAELQSKAAQVGTVKLFRATRLTRA